MPNRSNALEAGLQRLTTDPVIVRVEAVWVRWAHRELPELDVAAVEIGRVWRDADVGIRRIA